jgi:hypothetical protein
MERAALPSPSATSSRRAGGPLGSGSSSRDDSDGDDGGGNAGFEPDYGGPGPGFAASPASARSSSAAASETGSDSDDVIVIDADDQLSQSDDEDRSSTSTSAGEPGSPGSDQLLGHKRRRVGAAASSNRGAVQEAGDEAEAQADADAEDEEDDDGVVISRRPRRIAAGASASASSAGGASSSKRRAVGQRARTSAFASPGRALIISDSEHGSSAESQWADEAGGGEEALFVSPHYQRIRRPSTAATAAAGAGTGDTQSRAAQGAAWDTSGDEFEAEQSDDAQDHGNVVGRHGVRGSNEGRAAVASSGFHRQAAGVRFSNMGASDDEAEKMCDDGAQGGHRYYRKGGGGDEDEVVVMGDSSRRHSSYSSGGAGARAAYMYGDELGDEAADGVEASSGNDGGGARSGAGAAAAGAAPLSAQGFPDPLLPFFRPVSLLVKLHRAGREVVHVDFGAQFRGACAPVVPPSPRSGAGADASRGGLHGMRGGAVGHQQPAAAAAASQHHHAGGKGGRISASELAQAAEQRRMARAQRRGERVKEGKPTGMNDRPDKKGAADGATTAAKGGAAAAGKPGSTVPPPGFQRASALAPAARSTTSAGAGSGAPGASGADSEGWISRGGAGGRISSYQSARGMPDTLVLPRTAAPGGFAAAAGSYSKRASTAAAPARKAGQGIAPMIPQLRGVAAPLPPPAVAPSISGMGAGARAAVAAIGASAGAASGTTAGTRPAAAPKSSGVVSFGAMVAASGFGSRYQASLAAEAQAREAGGVAASAAQLTGGAGGRGGAAVSKRGPGGIRAGQYLSAVDVELMLHGAGSGGGVSLGLEPDGRNGSLLDISGVASGGSIGGGGGGVGGDGLAWETYGRMRLN